MSAKYHAVFVAHSAMEMKFCNSFIRLSDNSSAWQELDWSVLLDHIPIACSDFRIHRNQIHIASGWETSKTIYRAILHFIFDTYLFQPGKQIRPRQYSGRNHLSCCSACIIYSYFWHLSSSLNLTLLFVYVAIICIILVLFNQLTVLFSYSFLFLFFTPLCYNTFIPQIVYFLTNFKEIKLYEKWKVQTVSHRSI